MNTPIRLPYGVSNFEDLINYGYHYVDKTNYIEKLESLPDRYLFYLRPRKFGKSLFVSLLHHYYGLEYKDKFKELFGNLYIGQNPSPLANKYLVIKFEFTQIDTSSKESTLNGFLKKVRDSIIEFCGAYPQFFTLKEAAEINKMNYPAFLMSSLIILIKQKAPTHKLYIMVDEYDHFANQLIAFRLEEFKKVVGAEGFVRKFYEAIKEGTALGIVDRFFSTGITPITLDSMTSGFNIATNLSLDLRFVEMMGFTEPKVRELFELAIPQQAEKADQLLPIMKAWYDGYKFHFKAPNFIFNPNMALYFLKHYQAFEEMPTTMLDINISSDYKKVRRLLSVETPEENFKTLRRIAQGELVKGSITQEFSFEKFFDQSDFLSLLFYQGFLTIESQWAKRVTFRVPNYAIQEIYVTYFWQLLQTKNQFQLQTDQIQDAVEEMALKGNPHPFFELIHISLHHLANRDYQRFDEKYIKVIMMAQMMLTDAYYVDSEPETPAGYLDLTFFKRPNIPINHQYVFELKYLKKEDAKKLKPTQKASKKQLLNYIQDSDKLKDLTDLQAWTVVVIKDEVKVERVN
ncbi:MAG: AAA family ATPase [Chitinophagales bacterium]